MNGCDEKQLEDGRGADEDAQGFRRFVVDVSVGGVNDEVVVKLDAIGRKFLPLVIVSVEEQVWCDWREEEVVVEVEAWKYHEISW